MSFVEDLEFLLLDSLKREAFIKSTEDAYFEPSKEPETWKMGGKLVRLDVAVQALHLMSARICFRSLPQTVLQKENQLEEQLAKIVGSFGAGRILATLGRNVIASLLYVMNVFEAAKMAMETEATIRRQALKTQRELSLAYMGAGKPEHTKRKRKVWSRHPCKKQRAENKSWHNPQKRS